MQKAQFGFTVIEGRKSSYSACQAASQKAVQPSLFPFGSGRSIIFVSIPGITEREFASLVQLAQPALAVELRRAPRFDIGRLTRQAVFKWFDEAKCAYLDPVPWRESDETAFRRYIGNTLEAKKHSDRPIMFFMSTAQDTDSLRCAICDVLKGLEEDWQIFEVPGSLPR